jgi:hypothetical protein
LLLLLLLWPHSLAANDTQVNHSRFGLLKLLLRLRRATAIAAVAAAAQPLLLQLPLQCSARQLFVHLHVPVPFVDGDRSRAQQQMAVVVPMCVVVMSCCCCCCNRRLHSLWHPANTRAESSGNEHNNQKQKTMSLMHNADSSKPHAELHNTVRTERSAFRVSEALARYLHRSHSVPSACRHSSHVLSRQ